MLRRKVIALGPMWERMAYVIPSWPGDEFALFTRCFRSSTVWNGESVMGLGVEIAELMTSVACGLAFSNTVLMVGSKLEDVCQCLRTGELRSRNWTTCISFYALDLEFSKTVRAYAWRDFRVSFLSLKDSILWASSSFWDIILVSSEYHQYCEEGICGVLGLAWGMDCFAALKVNETFFF